MRRSRLPHLIARIAVAIATLAPLSGAALADIVPLGAQWRYLDNGSDQQSAWRWPRFNDSAWRQGAAQLGYGDGDETTVVRQGSTPNNKPVTTYFRHKFTTTSLPTHPLTLSVLRDDGIVVYLNGTEILRDNMPNGAITSQTLASSAAGGVGEKTLQTFTISPNALRLGENTLAAEVHQVSRTSSDISFDVRLSDSVVVRGPYLQKANEHGVTVRWRTSDNRNAVVRYGTNAANLNRQARSAATGKNHTVKIGGLAQNTRYYYSIGDSSGSFLSGTDQYFETHPTTGDVTPTRIWVLGDSGTADRKAAAVRDAYVGFNGSSHADVWLMLGDNAYNEGTDAEYQDAVFDMYPQTLQNSILWSTLGNHDGHSADSPTQSGPYYDIFSFPKAGESGGVASGTEAYYSFDYGNIHFISLDSYETPRSPGGAMATWLKNDLAATTQEWIIAYWHHPPYSKGSHDSDQPGRLTAMREVFVPILEDHGVDLILSGHSHSYERSMLINGHYGTSSTFGRGNIIDNGDGDLQGSGAYVKPLGGNNGAVYGVAGSSGKISNAPLDHPAMITNLVELGSMVIDVYDNQLDAVFLNDDGQIRDSFSIVHDAPPGGGSGPIELAKETLDRRGVNGPSWKRINFDPLTTGPHTLSVAWNGNAKIGYSIFRTRDQQRLAVNNPATSPLLWTGSLDASESYYLGVWAESGSADITATIQRATSSVIGQGRVDSDMRTAPRWQRIDFNSSGATNHTISVSWDSDADVRFQVRDASNNTLSPTVKSSNPGVWSGRLQANRAYYVSLWSQRDIANFTVSVDASPPAQ